MASAKPFIDNKIKQRNVLLFSKSQSPACKQCKTILDSYSLNKCNPTNFEVVEIEARQDCTELENYLFEMTLADRREVPHLFVAGKHIGGEKEIKLLHDADKLRDVLECNLES